MAFRFGTKNHPVPRERSFKLLHLAIFKSTFNKLRNFHILNYNTRNGKNLILEK